MSLTVRWTASAQREADRLDSQVRRRIVAALDRFAATEQGDVVRVKDVVPRQYRLRAGDWRVRFTLDRAAGVLNVLRVLPRDQAYR